MSHLALNLLLAIVWMLLQASFTAWTLLVGLFIGFLSITILELAQGRHEYARWAAAVLHLAGFFLVDLIRSNIILARDILRPVPRFDPALIRYPIADLSRTSTVVLSNLISLTPGTLTVDADDDGHAIYVHSLYARDPDGVRRRIDLLADLIRRTAIRQLPPEEGA